MNENRPVHCGSQPEVTVHKTVMFLLLMAMLMINVMAQSRQFKPSPAVSSPVSPAPANAPDKLTGDEHLPFKLNERTEAETEQPGVSGLLMRTLGALLLIVGLIAAAGWGLRRFGGSRFGVAQNESPELVVLHTVALGDRRSLSVIRFGERTLLIGSSGQGITLLDTIYSEDRQPVAPQPAVRTVADLLVDEAPPFEEELARVTLIESLRRDRRARP